MANPGKVNKKIEEIRSRSVVLMPGVMGSRSSAGSAERVQATARGRTENRNSTVTWADRAGPAPAPHFLWMMSPLCVCVCGRLGCVSQTTWPKVPISARDHHLAAQWFANSGLVKEIQKPFFKFYYLIKCSSSRHHRVPKGLSQDPPQGD